MKSIIIAFSLLFTVAIFAQEETPNDKVKTPKIVSKLPLNKVIKEDNIEVKFLGVVNDSRCPTGVNCMWAGEVEVKVEVTNHNSSNPKPEIKTLTLSEDKEYHQLFGNIFHADGFNISALNVSPYPVADKKIKPEDYELQFHVQR